MTAKESGNRASNRASNRAARPWSGLRRLSDRTSLRTKLIAATLALVAVALVVISIVGATFMRTYLLGQTDNNLRSLQPLTAQAVGGDPGAQGKLAENGYAVWWLPDGGSSSQVVQPVEGPYSGLSSGDAPPTQFSLSTQARLASNSGLTITVPGQSPGDRWRVISFAEPGGTMVLGTDVSSVYDTLRQLAGVDLIVSIVILLVLAGVGTAVVRANLRPLVDIEETAGEIADGHLNRRVPERDSRTEIGSLGRSLNTMLSQIESAFHAQEESEAEAHQSEERMRRFIADASHELRTPLTAIRGFAEYYRQRGGLVQRADEQDLERAGAVPTEANGQAAAVDAGGGGLTAEDLDRIMRRVEAEAARMGLLVEDLLLLARLDQQRPLAHRPVDLLSLAADAVHDARLLTPTRTIDLSVQPGAAFLVIGDEARLRQVIGNLMSNALIHTPAGTPIQVSVSTGILDPRAEDPTPAVILDVIDHGPGMTQEQARRVFERFYRADQARNRSTGGSGLGLAIVNALVTAQGGVASVRSSPGKGATFRIALPLAPEAMGSQHPDDDDQLDVADEPDVASEVATNNAEAADEVATSDAEATGDVAASDAEATGETGTDSSAETTVDVPEQWVSQTVRDRTGG
jgi:two-component system, OmpR family, sensor kinase